ncbi:MAG: putative Haloacid dehalogenase domain protein hydrolase [Promethearchaeota archaeon]|nr:MAG: putative Haloacid dehalogenase domain protein hydrolase [Candidatus Lokiarchaeota archaeon]
MTIKWIIFDAMGVIFQERNLLNQRLIPFIKGISKNIRERDIRRCYYKASLGKLSSFKFWIKLGLDKYYPEIEFDFLYNNYTLDREFLKNSEKFKKNFSLGLLTNHIKEWMNFLADRFNLNDYFEFILSSGDVGIRKPSKELYHYLIEKNGLIPEECIVVDDKLKNLNAASQVGLNTIRLIKHSKKVGFCSEFEVTSFKELFTTVENFFGDKNKLK